MYTIFGSARICALRSQRVKVKEQRVPEPGRTHAKSSPSLRFAIISGADGV